MPRILVIDSTPALVTLLQSVREPDPGVILPADTAALALQLAREKRPEVAVVDVEVAGLSLAQELKQAVPEMEVLVVTGNASLDSAIAAFKVGAFDYLAKPLDPADLQLRVSNAVEKVRLKLERLRAEEERALIEAHLREAAKMDSLGRLAGGVAHDFNNLLTVIQGSAEIVLSRMPATDPMRARVGEILDAAERAVSLTRQLLTFSRRKPVRLDPVDLNEVVSEMRQLLSRVIGKDIELVTNLETALWRTRADRDQLGQVVLNLAVNARDAMPKGGKLVLQTANKVIAPAEAASAGLAPGRYVVLSVSDNGCVMSPEVLARLFEPFFTTKERGTGLGLASVYGIVNQLGGAVRPYSELGVGSIFRVYLKALESPSEKPADSPAASAPLRGNGETVLLVDDDEGVRRVAARLLTAAGYAVLEARDGADALAQVSSRQGKVDLLLTDLAMPGMPGTEVVAALRHRRPGLKALYMSAYPASQFGLLSDRDQLLSKPFTEQELLDAIAQRLRASD